MNREIFKDVIGYEGLYRVSNFGRVIAVARKCVYTRNDKECSRELPERELIPQQEACDYLHVTLTKNGKRKNLQAAPISCRKLFARLESCFNC